MFALALIGAETNHLGDYRVGAFPTIADTSQVIERAIKPRLVKTISKRAGTQYLILYDFVAMSDSPFLQQTIRSWMTANVVHARRIRLRGPSESTDPLLPILPEIDL